MESLAVLCAVSKGACVFVFKFLVLSYLCVYVCMSLFLLPKWSKSPDLSGTERFSEVSMKDVTNHICVFIFPMLEPAVYKGEPLYKSVLAPGGVYSVL